MCFPVGPMLIRNSFNTHDSVPMLESAAEFHINLAVTDGSSFLRHWEITLKHSDFPSSFW